MTFIDYAWQLLLHFEFQTTQGLRYEQVKIGPKVILLLFKLYLKIKNGW